MDVTITKKVINDDFINIYLNNKFYIGTVQYYNGYWIAQLLWDAGGNFTKHAKSKEDAFECIEKWLTSELKEESK